jgi:hypothetical protein
MPLVSARFLEGLDELAANLRQCPDDMLWHAAPGTTNAVGALVQHLCGNLRHFVGAVLLGTGYVRDRQAEFEHHVATIDELLELVAITTAEVRGLADASDRSAMAPYPVPWHGTERCTLDVLLILVAHFRYHLGQLNYLRRISDHLHGTPHIPSTTF